MIWLPQLSGKPDPSYRTTTTLPACFWFQGCFAEDVSLILEWIRTQRVFFLDNDKWCTLRLLCCWVCCDRARLGLLVCTMSHPVLRRRVCICGIYPLSRWVTLHRVGTVGLCLWLASPKCYRRTCLKFLQRCSTYFQMLCTEFWMLRLAYLQKQVVAVSLYFYRRQAVMLGAHFFSIAW